MLYICYLGIGEPLVQTQVIPYLEGLASTGYGVVLLTFEPRRLPADERQVRAESLQARGIEWRALRYHKRPALPATVADIVSGIVYGAHLVHARCISVIHARGHVPATMALVLHWLIGTRFVFDIRGLLAEEYVDWGLWKPGGFLYRLVKRMESILLAHADVAVVLTRRARQLLLAGRSPTDQPPLVEVIPCCVDLRRFDVNPVRIRSRRGDLGFEGHPVVIYVGKFGGWYMASEMADFFCAAQYEFPDLRFLILTQSGASIVEQEFVRRHLSRDAYRCLTALPEEIPEYLALADFAVCFMRACPSITATSPTKVGEYLAAGLPIVFSAGIGDLDDLEQERIGALLHGFGEADYAHAAQQIRILLKDREATAQRCRAAAERYFSMATIGIPRYLRLYAILTGRETPDGTVSPPSKSPKVTEASPEGGLE